MDNNMGSSLIDNFESSFMNCIHSFTKQESAIEVDKGETNNFSLNTVDNLIN